MSEPKPIQQNKVVVDCVKNGIKQVMDSGISNYQQCQKDWALRLDSIHINIKQEGKVVTKSLKELFKYEIAIDKLNKQNPTEDEVRAITKDEIDKWVLPGNESNKDHLKNIWYKYIINPMTSDEAQKKTLFDYMSAHLHKSGSLNAFASWFNSISENSAVALVREELAQKNIFIQNTLHQDVIFSIKDGVLHVSEISNILGITDIDSKNYQVYSNSNQNRPPLKFTGEYSVSVKKNDTEECKCESKVENIYYESSHEIMLEMFSEEKFTKAKEITSACRELVGLYKTCLSTNPSWSLNGKVVDSIIEKTKAFTKKYENVPNCFLEQIFKGQIEKQFNITNASDRITTKMKNMEKIIITKVEKHTFDTGIEKTRTCERVKCVFAAIFSAGLSLRKYNFKTIEDEYKSNLENMNNAVSNVLEDLCR